MHFLHDTIFFLDKEMKKNNIGKANKEIETPTKNQKNTTTENEISKEYFFLKKSTSLPGFEPGIF